MALEGAMSAALAFLDGREREVLDLTCALVAAPSPNLPGDETAPAAVVTEALRRYGLPDATNVAMEPHRPNLIVRIDGAVPGPHLALCGHLDTKPVGEAAAEWRSDPFTPTFDGDRLYGLGSTDMKGAVAAMVLAGAAFAAVADWAAGSLSLVFTADEEYGSTLGAHYLVEMNALEGIDAIILGEPSGVREDWDAIRIVSRGVSAFRVLVRGTQTHSSISDMLPTVNAVEAMAQVMVGFRREFKPRYPAHPLCPTGPTINIGVKALGGVGYGVLPGYAEFWTDVRTIPGMDESEFREDVEEAVARAAAEVPEASVEVAFHPTLAWTTPTEVLANDPVVIASQRACEAVLGASPPLALFPGGTDAASFHGIGGIPTVAAFGPGQLPLAHGANEWVSATSVVQAMRMYALTALAYGAGTG
jgi:acetylornithine deacetylase/succinyl-diaminopimelate desuccinylase-like protein